jgi:methylmalonyl-CoA mutase N-terminal domain/subunit
MMQGAIARSAYAQQQAIESGAMEVVGVNVHAEDQTVPAVPAPDYAALAAQQVRRLAEARGRRDAAKVMQALAAVKQAAAQADAPLMPVILEAVRARATVGEISDVFRGVWGEYREV